MGGRRAHRYLPALPAARGDFHLLQGERHQASGHILARADNRVVFARVIKWRGFIDPANQLIGFAGHGRDDDDHVIAFGDFHAHALCRALDAVKVGNRGAAEFHHENGHTSVLVRRVSPAFTALLTQEQEAVLPL